MPVPNNEFRWRPNDNSSITNHRYDLEVSKWVKAVNTAQTSSSRPTFGSFTSDLGAIGQIIALPLLLIMTILLILVKLISAIFNYNIKIFPGDPPTGPIQDEMAAYRVDYAKFGADPLK